MKNILLIGLGRFGRHIAMELSELGHEIMAVDVNEGRVDKVLPYVTNAQIGDSTKEWIGKTVGELDIRRKYDINILAIKNNGELSMAISPDTFFTGNISLLVIGEHKAIKKCFHI